MSRSGYGRGLHLASKGRWEQEQEQEALGTYNPHVERTSAWEGRG